MENRIIKFRMFDDDSGQMIYTDTDDDTYLWDFVGGKIKLSTETTVWKEGGGETYEQDEWVKVDGTLMQFTGLLDKNGKEIYEGDIISSKFSDGADCNHVIEYKESSFIVRYYADGLDVGSEFTQKWINEYGKEIIGNIYSNPDLIK